MFSWESYVRARISECGADIAAPQATIAELASHLQELHEHWISEGFSESEARQRALAEIPDWNAFLAEVASVRIEEAPMQSRGGRVWIPGFVVLSCTSIALAGILQSGAFGDGFLLRSTVGIYIYLPWLLMQPLVAILAALLASRLGASSRERWYLVLFFLLPPLLVFGSQVFHQFTAERIARWLHPGLVRRYYLSCFWSWIVAPAGFFGYGLLLASIILRHSNFGGSASSSRDLSQIE